MEQKKKTKPNHWFSENQQNQKIYRRTRLDRTTVC